MSNLMDERPVGIDNDNQTFRGGLVVQVLDNHGEHGPH
jgi:hypothetical protein